MLATIARGSSELSRWKETKSNEPGRRGHGRRGLEVGEAAEPHLDGLASGARGLLAVDVERAEDLARCGEVGRKVADVGFHA